MSIVTDELRAKADELYHGDAICQEKSKFLVTEKGQWAPPNEGHVGMLCGYIKETGFVWLKQKKSTTHKFEKVGRLGSYATEITAYVEKGKIKKLTGVETKELMVWVPLSDIYLHEPPTGKITFKSPTGLFRTFSALVFELDGPDGGNACGGTQGRPGSCGSLGSLL